MKHDYSKWSNERNRRRLDRVDSIVFWVVMVSAVLGLVLFNNWPSQDCSTDTECMQMRGGDGGLGND